MKLSERLKHLRINAEMTQQGLAAAAKIPISTLRGLEQDQRTPSWATLQRLARALGATLGDFDGCELAAEKQRNKPAKKRSKKASQ